MTILPKDLLKEGFVAEDTPETQKLFIYRLGSLYFSLFAAVLLQDPSEIVLWAKHLLHIVFRPGKGLESNFKKIHLSEEPMNWVGALFGGSGTFSSFSPWRAAQRVLIQAKDILGACTRCSVTEK